jgi:transglutaminase-like putative cysteine protease
MLYDIGLRMTYTYDSPADAARHLLRVMPANLAGEQRLVSGHLDIRPVPEERSDRADFFGNRAVEVAYRSAHEAFEFVVRARVERLARAPEFDISTSLARLAQEIAAHRSVDADAPHHFLGPSSRIRLAPAITGYGRDQVRPGMSSLEAVRAVGLALHRDIRFDPEATTVDTPAEEAFANRHGVCQDISHIMIAGLRGLGVPAGYVSGYLRTTPPKGRPRLEGADAMHAWVRAWCGVDTGWVEFDPTNALMVGSGHVVVARGRDYSDVAPVKGISRTAGSQTTEQQVDVVPVDEA